MLRRCRQRGRGTPAEKTLNEHEEQRHEEDAEKRAGQHAAEYAGTDRVPGAGPGELGTVRLVTIVQLLAAGIVATVLAWGTVAGHAIRIARANPIVALRYE